MSIRDFKVWRGDATKHEPTNFTAPLHVWRKEAEKRGLLNLRRAPEALSQLKTKKAQELLVGLGILSKEELESRYHVRLERYIKDVLIELYTLKEIVDTLVLPAAFSYLATLTTSDELVALWERAT